MRRIQALLALIVLAALSGPAGTSSPADTAMTAGDWPVMAGTAGNTNANTHETSLTTKTVANLQLRWEMTAATWATANPVIQGGTAYDTCRHGIASYGVCAFDAITNQLHWYTPLTNVHLYSLFAITGTIMVAANDTDVMAVAAATGRKLWTYKPRLGSINQSANLLVDDTWVFVTTVTAASRGTLVALDIRTGQVAWSHNLGATAPVLGLAADGGLVIVPVGHAPSSFTLVALDEATGAPRWSYAGKDRVDGVTPMVDRGLVFMEGNSGHILAIDASTGALRWSSSVGLATTPGVLAANHGLLFAGDDTQFMALDERSGATVWRQAGYILSAVAGGDLLWASTTGSTGTSLYAIDAHTGATLRKIPSLLVGALAHGQVYAMDYSGPYPVLCAWYVPWG